MNILPSPAIVRPRALCPEIGESLPLEELVEGFFDRHESGAIEIVGGPGSGKTTAIAHLAEVLCPGQAVIYLDDATIEDVASAKALRLVVYTTARRLAGIADVSVELSPWGEDDLIEFLLAKQPDRCGSVLARIRAQADRQSLGGNPELCRLVLERMADNDSISGLREVLQAELKLWLSETVNEQLVQYYALARLRGMEELPNTLYDRLTAAGADRRLLRLLQHRAVQVMLATSRLRYALEQGEFVFFNRLPNALIRETAATVRDSEKAMHGLFEMLADRHAKLQSIAASILHATGTGWMPVQTKPSGLLPFLEGAQLAGAKWARVKLRNVWLYPTRRLAGRS